MFRIKFCLVVGSLLILSGCHSNPYANAHDPVQPTPPVRDKTGTGFQPFTNKPEPISIVEGDPTYTLPQPIEGHVATGVPVLAFRNCPRFAVCDASTGLISLSPKIGDATDPNNPKATVYTYIINVTVASSLSPTSFSGDTVVVLVHRKSSIIQVAGFPNTQQLNEGVPSMIPITIISTAAPTGPFTISGLDLPPGMTISSTGSPTRFNLNYAPDFNQVTTGNVDFACRSSFNRMCRNIKWTLNVSDPSGTLMSTPAIWTLNDTRQMPSYIAPSNVAATNLVADFEVQVLDPNYETVPRVTVKPPTDGTATVRVLASGTRTVGTLPYTLLEINWSGVPATYKGTTQTLTLQACVYDQNQNYNTCNDQPVTVVFN